MNSIEALLDATPEQLERAKQEYIRRHDEAYYIKYIVPITKNGKRGVHNILHMKPTPELQEYVRIIEKIVLGDKLSAL